MGDLFCRLGRHSWVYDLREATILAPTDPLRPITSREEMDGLREDARSCARCGRREQNISRNGLPDWRCVKAGADAQAR